VNPHLAEFLGTALLVLFGNGVVANVVLARTKGNQGGWIVITAGWGLAVLGPLVGAALAAATHLLLRA
jgi:glycerol uptake facilitator protein